MAIKFSHQNETVSCVSSTYKYRENLVLLVVLVLESKGLYYVLSIKIETQLIKI